MDDEFYCPHCGEAIAANSAFCRHCGASEDAGWGSDLEFAGGYAEEDDFDYDDYVAREFPDQMPETGTSLRQRNWIFLLIVLVCAGMLLMSILAAISGQL